MTLTPSAGAPTTKRDMLIAQLQSVRGVLIPAAASFGIAGVIGACALVFMVYRDTTPEGQANIKEREETQRVMIQSMTEQEKLKVTREQLAFEREKFGAEQRQKEK